MVWLLFEKRNMVSSLTPNEVKSRLAEYVSPITGGSFANLLTNRYSGYYKGFVSDNEFKIEPVIVGRNNFLPQITGQINSTENGSKISIVMKINDFTQVFIAMAAVFLFGTSIMILIKGAEASRFDTLFFTPLGMMVLIYLVMLYHFTAESVSSKKFLLEVFEADYE